MIRKGPKSARAQSLCQWPLHLQLGDLLKGAMEDVGVLASEVTAKSTVGERLWHLVEPWDFPLTCEGTRARGVSRYDLHF